MRNQPKPLNDVERYIQDRALEALQGAQADEQRVEIIYTKRNGDQSSSTGAVAFFNGQPGMDTGSVTILTEDKGMRTVNLHRITKWRRVS